MMHRAFRHLAAATTTAAAVLFPGTTPAPAPVPTCGSNNGVSIDDFLVWDGPGQEGSVPVRIPVPCDEDRTITYRTYDITAKAGEDYVGVTSGSIVVPAGATSVSIKIQIIADTKPEPRETFGVRLVSGADFDDADAEGTIYDN